MAIDLTPRWVQFVVCLPAMQYPYTSAVDNNKALGDRPFPDGIKLTDLDFLNPKSSFGTMAMPFTLQGNSLKHDQERAVSQIEINHVQQFGVTVVDLKLARAH